MTALKRALKSWTGFMETLGVDLPSLLNEGASAKAIDAAEARLDKHCRPT